MIYTKIWEQVLISETGENVVEPKTTKLGLWEQMEAGAGEIHLLSYAEDYELPDTTEEWTDVETAQSLYVWGANRWSQISNVFGVRSPAPTYAVNNTFRDMYLRRRPFDRWIALGDEYFPTYPGAASAEPTTRWPLGYTPEWVLQLATVILDRAVEIWPPCGVEDCSEAGLRGHDHIICRSCEALDSSAYMGTMWVANLGTTSPICEPCRINQMERCVHCGDAFLMEEGESHLNEMGECESCEEQYIETECCGERILAGDYVERPGDTCALCWEQLSPIEQWDHRPDLCFYPEYNDPEMEEMEYPNLYIGMELEASFPGHIEPRDATDRWRSELDPDLVYCKYDSSVRNGYEIVTHPMNPDWAMKHFPFSQFQELKDTYQVLQTHETTGTHIHFNKDAFTSSTLWKFLQIHYKLPEFCKIIGGREDGTYASFGHRDMQVQKDNLLLIAKEKGKGITHYDRYTAVNLRNEFTIELRYMRGGPWPDEIKKNIQWAKALYGFASYITVEDVRNGVLNNAGYFLWWINQQKDMDELTTWILSRIPQPLAIERRGDA